MSPTYVTGQASIIDNYNFSTSETFNIILFNLPTNVLRKIVDKIRLQAGLPSDEMKNVVMNVRALYPQPEGKRLF